MWKLHSTESKFYCVSSRNKVCGFVTDGVQNMVFCSSGLTQMFWSSLAVPDHSHRDDGDGGTTSSDLSGLSQNKLY